MKIGFIGAGKVGTSIGKYFSINNLMLSGYYSRNITSSQAASNFTNSKTYSALQNLIAESDLIFITTPDDAISVIIKDICSLNIKDKIICHTSGSLSSKIFSNINNSGAFFYSIHPMFAFPDKFNTYKNLKEACFSLEGDTTHLEKLKSLIESLGNKVFLIDAEKKKLYHLANVLTSNLVLSMIDLSCNYLNQCGIPKEDTLTALMPLIENNILNLKNTGSSLAALTGPIERNDIGTIKHHLEVMPKVHIPLYKLLSLNLLKLAIEKHPERNYDEILKYLGGV